MLFNSYIPSSYRLGSNLSCILTFEAADDARLCNFCGLVDNYNEREINMKGLVRVPLLVGGLGFCPIKSGSARSVCGSRASSL